jgi:hypothetical protein
MPMQPESVAAIDAEIATTIVDPAVRYWVRSSLRWLRDCDPCDAADDAQHVPRLMTRRADAVIAEALIGIAVGLDHRP